MQSVSCSASTSKRATSGEVLTLEGFSILELPINASSILLIQFRVVLYFFYLRFYYAIQLEFFQF